MKHHIIILILFLFICAGVSAQESPRQIRDFNDSWTFHLGDVIDAQKKDFDDSKWRKLNLPHDWAIEGKFCKTNPAGSSGGALPGGIGWYRKVFTVDKLLEGKQHFLLFDGVYMNSEVWINGVRLGKRPFGYISFQYELTKHFRYGEENVIAVKVDNSQQPNSRWYSGSGIYRNVWLISTEPVHVDLWGTYVTTPYVSNEKAEIRLETTIKNALLTTQSVDLITSVLDAKGEIVCSVSDKLLIDSMNTSTCASQLELNNPTLWSIENPYLYSVVTRVYVQNKLTDEYTTSLGIRSFRFDPQKGFFLNDKPVKIKGVCLHHDLGCLGAAVNTRAIERQLEIMKRMGVNGIRTAHNPPAPELLNLCDKMGFIVVNETFDVWRKRKTQYDYSLYFNEWYKQDLTDHILRDRNHPSIFAWSIGNEVLEQWTNADADTLSLEQANLLLNMTRDESSLYTDSSGLSYNSMLTIKLAEIVRNLDPTRPITTGNNETNPNNHIFKSGALDMLGVNYHENAFKQLRKNFPDKPLIATETTSALMTRGYYRMPSDSVHIWPVRWDIPFYDDSYSCSSYDNCHVPWGTTHEKMWNIVKKNDYISGFYIWTGFDYLGEPTPFTFPARSSYFGVVDLAGIPKDIYYMYQAEWTDEKVLHVFPHWNWEPGQSVDIWAYYNQADEVELFVNGVSQGIRQKSDNQYHVSWSVVFVPGSIKVVSRKKGQEVLSKVINTAGKPCQIRLIPDRDTIHADGKDLSFITVNILDEAGNLCPFADNSLQFTVSGNGSVAGVDNGSPTSMESFKTNTRKAFYGKCLLVVRHEGDSGLIQIQAESPGLKTDKITIKSRRQ